MRRMFCVILAAALLLMGIPGIGGAGQDSARAEKPHIVQILANLGHSLALFSDGSLYAWGANSYGKLGDGTTKEKHVPTWIGTGFTAIAAGELHSLALKNDELYAWGSDGWGELGDGNSQTSKSRPIFIGTGYTAIAAGAHHTLALKGDTLYAWGKNSEGQLGDGTTMDKHVPIPIGTGYTAIAAGGSHSLALKGDELYAWGLNTYGQVGDGTTVDRLIPTRIGTGFTAIAAGAYHSLAMMGDTLYAWGCNWQGQVGDGTAGTTNGIANHKYIPTKVGTGFSAISAGNHHSLALKGGALYAWGGNQYGALGDGTVGIQNSKYIPTRIGTDEGYTLISAGWYHSLAAKDDALYAWGYNDFGRLGDGTTESRLVPTRIDFPAPPAPTPAPTPKPTPAPTPDPLSISNFSVQNSSLNVGDKAVFTVETGKGSQTVRLYDQDSRQVASTKSYKSKGSKRIWTVSLVMAASGQFRYHTVAVSGSRVGNPSPEVAVSVSDSSLEVKGFTINSSALNVGETVTFKVTTGKLASKLSILDASNATFASSSKPSKTTGTQKIWTLQRRLTEGDMGSIALRAQVDSKDYGTGPASAALSLTVADGLPRVISVTVDKTAVKRGTALDFVVMTNEAATSVWILNDKKEKWQQLVVESTPENRRTWRVATLPRQLGGRKFFAQAYQGNLPGSKVYVKTVRVIK